MLLYVIVTDIMYLILLKLFLCSHGYPFNIMPIEWIFIKYTIIHKFWDNIDKLLEREGDTQSKNKGGPRASLHRHVFVKHSGLGRKYCRGCYQKKQRNEITKSKVRKVTTYCKDCPDQPRYCLECFSTHHHILDSFQVCFNWINNSYQ